MERAVGVIRLFRPINSLMMGFAVIVGALLVADNAIFAYPLKLSLGLLTGFTLTGSQMAVNDYYDREIDLINEPRRPIPSGLVKPYEAVYYASILGFIGLTAALLTNITCFIVAVISYLISLGYVTEGKRTGFPGNLMVSTCIAVPFLYGALAIGAEVEPILLVFMAMVFLSNTGREVTKGIVDVVGDRSR
ncbi:MAG: geranylgeranylglycerol-phosphate geranylgeranyltransferase, partial [Candidatus Bathyarchaeia archaeon]